jgi:hypothetical protein
LNGEHVLSALIYNSSKAHVVPPAVVQPGGQWAKREETPFPKDLMDAISLYLQAKTETDES